ncbi:MAG: hypothetical protein AAGH43_07200 [Pseudomonadota bacterium]
MVEIRARFFSLGSNAVGPLTKYLRFSASAFIASVLLISAVQAGTAESIPRTVLALYDGAAEAEPSLTVIHQRAQMPLEHLGYRLRYIDVSGPLPDLNNIDETAAVLTWFGPNLAEPIAVWRWLVAASQRDIPVVSLGTFGSDINRQSAPLINRVLGTIGLQLGNGSVTRTHATHIVQADSELIGFERNVDPVPPAHPVVLPRGQNARIALELETTTTLGTASSIVVATGPGGGFAAPGYGLHYDEQLEKVQWIIDPFEFFRRAIGERVFPVPDVTTLSGQRLYFSHVDGDGWNNRVLLEGLREEGVIAAQVMLDELIAPYPDLPVAVGLVADDLLESHGGGLPALEAATQIYALPQVETASHTCSHPFFWSFYEQYNREEELEIFDRLQPKPTLGMLAQAARLLRRGEQATDPSELLIARQTGIPRAYLRRPFDLDTEVNEAIARTNAIAPPERPVSIYLWSGDTRPFEDAIRTTRQAGVANMNGGDSRLDAQYPSVGYVSPISRPVGAERQIYAVNSNENTYTNLWTDHFHGYLQVRETWANTDWPRRLKGVNLYYHAYSAERLASLEAIRTLLDWARDADIIPIEAARYAAIAEGFYSTQLEQVGPNSWSIHNRGALQTVRFDAADDLVPKIASSTGVLGWSRHAGSLYVALDEAVETAVISLQPVTSQINETTGLHDEPEPWLRSSRWHVFNMARTRCGLSFEAQGYGAGRLELAGLEPGAYQVQATTQNGDVVQMRSDADVDGILQLPLNLDALDSIEIEISCVLQ